MLLIYNWGQIWVQEDDVIGILASDNIADLKPLGDRLLVEVSLLTHAQMAVKFTLPLLLKSLSKGKLMLLLPVLIQIEEGKDETDAGLLLTSSTKEQPTIGKVLLSLSSFKCIGLLVLSFAL